MWSRLRAFPRRGFWATKIGTLVRTVHEEHGVRFHLSDKVRAISEREVQLEPGAVIGADLVDVGIGVKPALELAQQACLTVDRGIAVDEYLQTNIPVSLQLAMSRVGRIRTHRALFLLWSAVEQCASVSALVTIEFQGDGRKLRQFDSGSRRIVSRGCPGASRRGSKQEEGPSC